MGDYQITATVHHFLFTAEDTESTEHKNKAFLKFLFFSASSAHSAVSDYKFLLMIVLSKILDYNLIT